MHVKVNQPQVLCHVDFQGHSCRGTWLDGGKTLKPAQLHGGRRDTRHLISYVQLHYLLQELGLAVEEVKRLKNLLEVEKEKSEVSEALLEDAPAAEGGDAMKKLVQDNAQLKNALSAMEAESKEISKKITEEQVRMRRKRSSSLHNPNPM